MTIFPKMGKIIYLQTQFNSSFPKTAAIKTENDISLRSGQSDRFAGRQRIFVVEDDAVYRRMIAYVVGLDPSHEVYTFSTGQECLQHLHFQPFLISLDFTLPDMNGDDILKQIKKYDPTIEVVILSGQQDLPTAVKLVKDGAFDYITKDSETKNRLLNTIRHIKNQQRLQLEVNRLQEEIADRFHFDNFVLGSSPPMQRLSPLLRKIIDSDASVTISGEPGTGKEAIARAIHYNSCRRHAPFVVMDLEELAEERIEAEVFSNGDLGMDHGGTLMLKNLPALPSRLQARLLRTIEKKEQISGETNEKKRSDVRLIFASQKALGQEVVENRLRQDLYHRLMALPLALPPLRERGEDVLLLAQYFLRQIDREDASKNLCFSREAKMKLLNYDYPGNVRELKSVVELAVMLSEGKIIEERDIRFHQLEMTGHLLLEELSLEQYKKKILDFYLAKYDNDIPVVSEKLKIGKSTIYRMLKKTYETN